MKKGAYSAAVQLRRKDLNQKEPLRGPVRGDLIQSLKGIYIAQRVGSRILNLLY